MMWDAGQILAEAVSREGQLQVLVSWLTGNRHTQELQKDSDTFNCSRSEFVTYFLSYLRNQTESILQTNINALQILQHQASPEKLLSQKKKAIATGNITGTPDAINQNNLSVKHDTPRHESPSREKTISHKKPGRRVKTKLFNENEPRRSESFKNEIDESNMGFENMAISSTPVKMSNFTDFPPLTSPVMPNIDSCTSRNSSRFSQSDSPRERCDTPRITHSRNSRMSSAEKSLSLGDYIINASKVSSKKKKTANKNTSNETAESSNNIDISNADMFPEIGSKRTRNSLEKRRIKPTNIDNSTSSSSKSFTINSFNSETFQQPPSLPLEENQAFKQQKFVSKEHSNSFDTERNILKHERHKLMEKFNILNTSNTVKICPVTPLINVIRKDSIDKTQNLIEADFSKIISKDKIEKLVEIYNVLLRNNYVLSVSTEIYFLISIVLSKQGSDDYDSVENKLKNDNNEYLLRSLHNCSYFAIKSLWIERYVLEVMLDKFSLKLLGENKRVRGFYPDLAKFLLNLYSLKCETDMWGGRDENSVIILENRFTNGIVCFNSETDNAEMFPNILCFQNFKKQRDMFYEILRWWSESANQSMGTARASLRSRVKSLLSLAISPTNHAHLARLLTTHMLSECISNSQESKLSKLQRRLTGAAPTLANVDSHRQPRFSTRELFYRDFLLVADNEAFHAHVRDIFVSEICNLDVSCLPSCDERANSSCSDVRQEYLNAVKRLRLLAKLLGFLVSLPYQASSPEYSGKNPVAPPMGKFTVPKDNVLQSEIVLRNHSLPPMDLQSMLTSAVEQNRLSITIPWLIQYLAMLDCASLRIRYYERLLQSLFQIYFSLRVDPDNGVKRATIVFLKLCLGWLFELPNFPQEKFYEYAEKCFRNSVENPREHSETEASVDFVELIEESVLAEVCPYLREFNVLLLTSQPSGDLKDVGSTFRHITPVTMSLNNADRARNKERELQARLEEELIRGQPSSTRRVLELVADRVTSSTVKELSSSVLVEVRARCRARALETVRVHQSADTTQLLKQLQQLYVDQLKSLQSQALEIARRSVSQRSGMALRALLASGTVSGPLEAVAMRASLARISKWMDDNWSNVGVLCKDVKAEMGHLLMLGENSLPVDSSSSAANLTQMLLPKEQFDASNISAAEHIMEIRDTICQLLEYADHRPLPALLEKTNICCCPENIFITAVSKRAIIQLSVDLAVIVVGRKPSSVTENLLNKFNVLWDKCCPNRQRNDYRNNSVQDEDLFNPRDFAPDDERMATPVSSDDEEPAKPLKIVIVNDFDARTTKSGEATAKFVTSEEMMIKKMGNLTENNINDIHKSDDDITNFLTDTPKSNVDITPKSSKHNVTANSMDDTPNGTHNSTALTEAIGETLLDLFDRILCPRNMAILTESRCGSADVWDAMASLLLFLLRNDFLSEDSLTEQCLAVYRQDWPQNVLESLSRCMRSVSARRGRNATGKFTLFLDFLSEYCSDMAYDPQHIAL